jgi:hypothetical protein
MPKFEGDFEGEILHAKDYKTPDQLRGKKIVVIGAGNSACDLASEAARVGKKAFISIRSSAWFLPKTVMGQPLSAFSKPWVPDWIQRLGLKIGLKIIIGDLKHYGLPTPDHKIFEKHPTIGTELLHYIKHGKVKPKPHIAKLSGKYVHFTDGSVEEIDMIVAATGYHLSYPFLPKELQRVKGVVAQVYGDSMFEDIKGLYLIGWQQARGGVGALAPAGGGLITRYLRLQEEISVPLGGVLKALGEEIPKTHLIGMFQILKNIKHAHKTFSSLRKKALKMAEENPNFENPSFPLPSNLSKDLTVY